MILSKVESIIVSVKLKRTLLSYTTGREIFLLGVQNCGMNARVYARSFHRSEPTFLIRCKLRQRSPGYYQSVGLVVRPGVAVAVLGYQPDLGSDRR